MTETVSSEPDGETQAGPGASPRARTLERALETAAALLPAQGPISIFVHHNTLHAFESLPFETAVAQAGELLGCEPYLAEAHYREELVRGRIRREDLEAVAREDLGAGADRPVAGLGTRLELRLLLLTHAVERPRGAELEWILAETHALDRRGREAPPSELCDGGSGRGPAHASQRGERAGLLALWRACERTVAGAPPAPTPPRPRRLRHRDLLLEATGIDTDATVHPLLIRVCAAYLDQGLAYWPMPGRELGLYRCFRRLYAQRGGPPSRFARALALELARQEAADTPASNAAQDCLDALGVPQHEWEDYVRATLLALRGWAGMIHQIETRPDRVPVHAPPARLVDFLAVRLVAERCALEEAARRELGWRGPLAELRPLLEARCEPPAAETLHERAFPLFQVAQILGAGAAEVGGLAPEAAAEMLAEVEGFGELERRRLFQLAYERRYRVELLDALAAHAAGFRPAPAHPSFQAVFCIDEREESLRRHLEAVEPACETFGAAGFFGVAMYYRGAGDARPVPLCPVVVRPAHEVEELVAEDLLELARRRTLARRAVGQLGRALHVGSRTFTRGAVLSALLGALLAFPLVSRVLFPRMTARLRRHAGRWLRPPGRTWLALDPRPELTPQLGARAGFTIEEQATIVHRLLEETGLAGRLAPLVLVVGHGSSSLNNPHESAHDCGACGGGRGGPNARAFAWMANDPRVRARLLAQGLAVPEATVFVGAQHDSCDDAILYYDLDAVPEERRAELAAARAALDLARALNAQERCRRFASAPPRPSPASALAHVEARAEDLAQPRPEYGHATNAACLVGRRARTRGLYLDRRVFLASYDPEGDEQGTVLERLLGAVAPVCAGISLEYYFSTVDPHGYGCHTKLPHNPVSLLGVMDGHLSDLRPGLPWQMVEIHEPLRLLTVLEAEPARVLTLLARIPELSRLVRHGWIQLATLSPRAARVHVFDRRSGAFVQHLGAGSAGARA